MSSKTIKLELVAKDSAATTALVTSEDFQQARLYVAEIRDLGRRANHVSVLLGAELNRLHAQHGISRGRPNKSLHSTNFIPWDKLVKQETGLEYEVCLRCMKFALGAKSHIKVLTAEDVVNTPFAQLPEPRRKAVTAAIQKVVDGKSMAQLMLDFGVVKARKVHLPPPGGKSAKNDHKGGAANREESEGASIEFKRELAQGHIEEISAMMGSEAWEFLEDADLVALDAALDKWHQATGALIKKRKDQASRAKGKGGKA